MRHPVGTLKLGREKFFSEYSPSGFLDRSQSKLRPYYKAAIFLCTYAKKFDVDMLLRAHYVTHWVDVDMSGAVTNDDLLNTAEKLIKDYASASMVITSRIHAGLPCLGLNTPVVFIESEEVTSDGGTFNTPGRLGGLLDFFRTLVLYKGEFTTSDEVFAGIGKICGSTVFRNKETWKPYAEALAERVSYFMGR